MEGVEMGTTVEGMKQTDPGLMFFRGSDAGMEIMSKNFNIFNSINDSWADFLRRSAREGRGENAGKDLPLQKATEFWQQWPAQALLRFASSAGTLKECMQYCVGRQKTYTDLGIAWLNCLQKMTQACREARQNGSGPAEAWTGCLKAWGDFNEAEAAFATERMKSFFQLLAAMTPKEKPAEPKEAAGMKEGKTSRA
jgi:hypothetical protein